jgi:Tol biopolymer transport system component
MTLAPGTRLGPYEIVAPLGSGGMGEVYRARDTRLARDVAIKALPAAFAQDAERVGRFEREAKLLASLSHANVGAIYGLEEAAGARYLVLELVEGETLAARLERGALPLEEALEVCRQVAAALEAAHEAGIIHRDLKPGNVMLTAAGGVKVLDFGLAKGAAASETSSDPSLSASPTLTNAATGAGVILGTAAYMSPEQARGKPVDKRTDIWSLGCVLYECLTGRKVFEGETLSDLIARILEREPDLGGLPARTPARVRELLARCLEKDARRRLRDVGDARIELEAILAARASGESGRVPAAAARAGSARATLAGGAVLALVSMAATLVVLRLGCAPAPPPLGRFELREAKGTTVSNEPMAMAVSPDGRTIAFVASDSSAIGRVYLRPLASLIAQPLAGTEGATQPFWSPDGRSIAFFAEGKLKKLAAAGGPPEVLCAAPDGRGGAWSPAGVIVFAPTSQGPLFRVSASGGDPAPASAIDSTRGELAHRFPRFLPDGRHFVFTATPPRAGRFDICVGALDSPSHRRVMSAPSGVEFASPGYLLYARGGALMAQRVDPRSLKLVGDPVHLEDSPGRGNFSGGAVVNASRGGTLAYLNEPSAETRLVSVDPGSGAQKPTAVAPARYAQLAVARDGRVALSRENADGGLDIWIADPVRGTATRSTAAPGTNELMTWSPDDAQIFFMSDRDGPQKLYVKPASGSSPEQAVVSEGAPFKRSYGWSSDGRYLFFGQLDPRTGWDVWVLPLFGDRKAVPFAKTPSNEEGGDLSPDGRWLAYQSDESGRPEIYVQAFPAGGAKYQVTTDGGFYPRWTADGRHIVFSVPPQGLSAWSVDVELQPGFRVAGSPREVVRFPANSVWNDWTAGFEHDFALVPVGGGPPPSIVVLSNWTAALRKR